MVHVWEITFLADGWYDIDENFHQDIVGTRTVKGTEDDAEAFARKGYRHAVGAKIERVAVILPDGKRVPFAAHEIKVFTLGL